MRERVPESAGLSGGGGHLFDAETRGKRSRRDIAHHDLERNDLDLANQLLAHIEALEEMGRQAKLIESEPGGPVPLHLHL